MALITKTNYQFVSSNGADIEQDFLIIGTTFDAIAQDAGVTQRRTDCGRGRTYQAGYEVFNESELVGMCNTIGDQAVELLYAEECPTGETSCLDIDQSLIPDEFEINQIYPNPFNPVSIIEFQVTYFNYITIEIYNIESKLIDTLYKGKQTAGIHSIAWNASLHPSGLYLLILNIEKDQENLFLKI